MLGHYLQFKDFRREVGRNLRQNTRWYLHE